MRLFGHRSDERPTEEAAFKDKNAAERYLYSCYAFMPKERRGAIYIKEVIVLPIMTGNFLRNPYRGQYR